MHDLGKPDSLDTRIVLGDMQIPDETSPVLARDGWPAVERAYAAAKDLLIGTEPLGEVDLDNADLRFESAARVAHGCRVRKIPGHSRSEERRVGKEGVSTGK